MTEIADTKENGVRSKADLFLAVSQKNVLRRESGLPLLDMQAEHDRDLLQAYDTACRQYWSVYEQMKLEVLAEFRRIMPGYGASAGGRWAIAAVTEKRFRSFLKTKGHVPQPDPNLVRYGEDRTWSGCEGGKWRRRAGLRNAGSAPPMGLCSRTDRNEIARCLMATNAGDDRMFPPVPARVPQA